MDDKQKILFEALKELTEIRVWVRDNCDMHYKDDDLTEYNYFRGGYNAVDSCQRAILNLMGSMSVGEFKKITNDYKWQV